MHGLKGSAKAVVSASEPVLATAGCAGMFIGASTSIMLPKRRAIRNTRQRPSMCIGNGESSSIHSSRQTPRGRPHFILSGSRSVYCRCMYWWKTSSCACYALRLTHRSRIRAEFRIRNLFLRNGTNYLSLYRPEQCNSPVTRLLTDRDSNRYRPALDRHQRPRKPDTIQRPA